LNLPIKSLLSFVAGQEREAEEHSDKMVHEKKVCVKQWRVNDFLHEEKIAPAHIHRHLLNVYRDKTMDVRTVRWWVARF
jgi:hypothetical protein